MTALLDFMQHFGILPEGPPRKLLERVASQFSKLPYENITKIIKRAEAGSDEKARRLPDEVIRDHITWGAGGTCFSLTHALATLIRELGFRTEYVLADRSYGQDTHCALLVWLNDTAHLLDPGFLISDPTPLPENGEMRIQSTINCFVLRPEERPDRVSLSTVRKGVETYRLTYKTSPVDEAQFFKAWDASFGWEMMKYPLLTRASGSRHIYLNGKRIQVREGDSIRTQHLSEDVLVSRIAAEFHIHPSLVAHALTLLREKGEKIGGTSDR